jgi:hypothetical protein
MARLAATALVLTALSLSACNLQQSRAVSLMKQWGQKCKEAADLLAGVKDAASAKAAAPRLEKLVTEMDKIQGEIDRVYDPSEVDPADESAIMEEVGGNIVQMQRLMTEVARIGKQPEIQAALGKSWDRLSGYDVILQGGMLPEQSD